MIMINNDPFGKEFDKRIAKMQRDAAVGFSIWVVFVLAVMATLGGVAVHFLRKIW